MTVKKRGILLTVMTFVLCLALVAGGTYALFSDSVRLKNHLVAGELDITLTRTKLTATYLDDTTGYLVGPKVTHPDPVDFTDPTGKSIFEIPTDSVIVPGCSYNAEMKIENNSDVAFGYWIEIDPGVLANIDLAEQLMVSVTVGNVTKSVMADKLGGTLGSETEFLGTLIKGASQTFTVTLTFCDDVALDENDEPLYDFVNNDAMNDEFDFDIIVHAVQVTTAP